MNALAFWGAVLGSAMALVFYAITDRLGFAFLLFVLLWCSIALLTRFA